MKHFLYTSLFLLVAINVFGQQTIDLTMQHDGITRQYRLYVPGIYNGSAPVPLLFNLHGYGSNNLQQTIYGDFRGIADTANFIICLPNGTPDAGGSLRWNSGFATGVDDVGFISTLIDSISANYSINPARIYSTGMSNGGFMSLTLACELSDRIAAIASVTGSMTTLQQATCAPQRPISVMQIHGTSDPTVPYIGSTGVLPIETVVDYWVSFNSCPDSPILTTVPDVNTTDGSTAERFDYMNCDAATSVVFYKITGGGHTWPGSIIMLAGTNKDFNASREIWMFFRQYQHPDFPEVVSVPALPIQYQFTAYPNPFTDVLQLNSPLDDVKVEMFDVKGKLHLSANISQNTKTLNLSDLPDGVYFLHFHHQLGTRVQKVVKW